jgi:hypothetical protein
VCTTCLNVLDSPGISLLVCPCCPFHSMVCARTCLICHHMHTPRPGCQGHMHARLLYKHFQSVQCPRASLSALNGLLVHHLVPPESLGIIAWLLHCCSLAVCAKACIFKDSPDCCHEHPNFVQPLCQPTCLSASSTCLHTYMHTHCHPFQVDHVWSCPHKPAC